MDSDKVPRASPYSGYHRAVFVFDYRACTYYGWPFNAIHLTPINTLIVVLQPRLKVGLGSSPFARRY